MVNLKKTYLCCLIGLLIRVFSYFTPRLGHRVAVSFAAPRGSDDGVRPPYRTALKMLLGHAPYQRLLLGSVFGVLAFQVHYISAHGFSQVKLVLCHILFVSA